MTATTAKRPAHERPQEARLRTCGPDDLQASLRRLTGIDAHLPTKVMHALTDLFEALGPPRPADANEVSRRFYGQLNSKLGANDSTMSDIYSFAASHGVTFNYHGKKALKWAVDCNDKAGFIAAMYECGTAGTVASGMCDRFVCVEPSTTRDLLRREASRPSKLRKALLRHVAEDVLSASAGCLVWVLWPNRKLRRYFDQSEDEYGLGDDFMKGLRQRHPDLFSRSRSLVIRAQAPLATTLREYMMTRDRLTAWIRSEYDRLDNYGHIALMLEMPHQGGSREWELAADLTLMAERHHQEKTPLSYYRHDAIEAETIAHSSELSQRELKFHIPFEGFTYRDLFVLHDAHDRVRRLVLLLQKNRRDETLIPCPACRSLRVAGNSYPSFGVKSWECRNPLCLERSIYNRGKRYSFKALLTQEAIEDHGNTIPPETVGRWRRDVLQFRDDSDIVEMLIRHYSMRGDTVLIAGTGQPSNKLGRTIRKTRFLEKPITDEFWNSPFISRIRPIPRTRDHGIRNPPDDPWVVLQGDAGYVLSQFRDNQFDRAITSPPYFNAREYSQWPNLYCYLHDMASIHQEVLRVLKPGGIYAFNVFDYFDNERTINLSAMGKKRLSLSSLFVWLFREMGFELGGNVVWDKGFVEGKRAFNAGNFSPFYQSPINCWEHVLLFRKPKSGDRVQADPVTPLGNGTVTHISPVVKMVRGNNVHGHSAPFPLELPMQLMSNLQSGSLVLDPFGGSGTTARAALTLGHRCVLVEKSQEYCELARTLTGQHEKDLHMSGSIMSLF